MLGKEDGESFALWLHCLIKASLTKRGFLSLWGCPGVTAVNEPLR